jgi:hypothetical protein
MDRHQFLSLQPFLDPLKEIPSKGFKRIVLLPDAFCCWYFRENLLCYAVSNEDEDSSQIRLSMSVLKAEK